MHADGEEKPRRLSSNAWLRHGPKGLFGWNEPGMLLAVGDRVSFVTKQGPMFEADLPEIKVVWPRIELGGGVHLTVDGKIYRLGLIRPKGVAEFDKTASENMSQATREFLADQLWEGSYLFTGIADIHKGRASGKEWKAYFSAANG